MLDVTITERIILSLLPSVFLLGILFGNCEASYIIDKSIKLQNSSYKKITLKKIKWLFVFYEHKNGVISKVAFIFSIIGYFLTILYLTAMILSIAFINVILFWIMIGLGISCVGFIGFFGTVINFKCK